MHVEALFARPKPRAECLSDGLRGYWVGSEYSREHLRNPRLPDDVGYPTYGTVLMPGEKARPEGHYGEERRLRTGGTRIGFFRWVQEAGKSLIATVRFSGSRL